MCTAQVGVNVSLNPFPVNRWALRRGSSCQSDWGLMPQLEKPLFSEDPGVDERGSHRPHTPQRGEPSILWRTRQHKRTLTSPFLMCSFSTNLRVSGWAVCNAAAQFWLCLSEGKSFSQWMSLVGNPRATSHYGLAILFSSDGCIISEEEFLKNASV